MKRIIYCVIPTFTLLSSAPRLRMDTFVSYFKKDDQTCVLPLFQPSPCSIIRSQISMGSMLLSTIKKYKTLYPHAQHIIFHRSSLFFPWLIVAKYLFSCRIIQDFHTFYWFEKYSKKQWSSFLFFILPEYITIFLSDVIVSVSSGITNYIVPKILRKKTITIPNALSTEEMKDFFDTPLPRGITVDTDTMRVCFVGNAGQWMDMDMVCEAVKKVPEITLYIIGDGEALYEKNMVNTDRIRYMGRLSHKETLACMKYMDAFITPYTHRYQPSQITQYYAAKKNREYIFFKKPIIVGDVPAKDELFATNTGIFLYDPKQVSSLIQAFKDLCTPELYRKKSEEIKNHGASIFLEELVVNSGFESVFNIP